MLFARAYNLNGHHIPRYGDRLYGVGQRVDVEHGDAAELLWRTWATMACKAAVKLTTRLSREEALVLWRDLHACAQPYFCPHGRPTVLRIDTAQLVGHFGRE